MIKGNEEASLAIIFAVLKAFPFLVFNCVCFALISTPKHVEIICNKKDDKMKVTFKLINGFSFSATRKLSDLQDLAMMKFATYDKEGNETITSHNVWLYFKHSSDDFNICVNYNGSDKHLTLRDELNSFVLDGKASF